MDKYLETKHGVLYNTNCLDYMKSIPDNFFSLVITDPPYGIGEGGKKNSTRGKRFGSAGKGAIVKPTDFVGIEYDDCLVGDEVFYEIKRVSRNQIIFGGNYYGRVLGNTSCYIVWDKDNGTTDFADCELAWTSFNTAVRKIKWRWNGMLQEDMKNKEKRYYPGQKPVPVMEWIINKYAKVGQTIFDPFCGSGSTLLACENLGYSWTGCDRSERACDIVKMRFDEKNKEIKQLNLWVED